MPMLEIPEPDGLLASLPGASKARSTLPPALGLTLNDATIEEMIRCIQSGKGIQLSLGDAPSITYGAKTQHLTTVTDPFTHEIYRTRNEFPSDKMPKFELSSCFIQKRLIERRKGPLPKRELPPLPAQSTDAALLALQSSLASENAKKAENTTKYIPDGAGLPVPGRRGAGKAKQLPSAKRALGRDTTSPSLGGKGSPASSAAVPLSQQQAERAKISRMPVIHLLALAPMTEKALRGKMPSVADEDFASALRKVGDMNDTTGKYELRKPFYKELDPWEFKYDSDDDRQKVIAAAIKQFDKMRLGVSEPEWQKLMPKGERNTGKIISKLQAQIAAGSGRPASNGTPKPVNDGEEDDLFGDKVDGESMTKPSTQQPNAKAKKVSESQAQAKRLLSKKPPKAAAASKLKIAAPKPSTTTTGPTITKKEKAAEAKPSSSKVLSAAYISDSDDEEESHHAPARAKPAPKVNRPRQDEVETSDSSIPLSKKTKPVQRASDTSSSGAPLSTRVKKDTPLPRVAAASKAPIASKTLPALSKTKRPRPDDEETSDSSEPLSKKTKSLKTMPIHRAPDVSHASGTISTTAASTFSAAPTKSKTTSPHKSSPLSSEPTNVSDLDHSDRTSSSVSPARHTKTTRSPIHKRHQKSSSVASSTSSTSTRYLKPEVVALARRFRLYYPKYEALYQELSALGCRDVEKEQQLLDMHDRLSLMKKQIYGGVVEAV